MLRGGANRLRDGVSGLSSQCDGLAAKAGEAGVDGHLFHVRQGHTAQSSHCMQHLLPPWLLEGRGHRDRGQGTAS